MPTYTLYYFNGRGRAEILRMLFNAGDLKFNDKRIEFNEWEKIKNDMPCKRVPVLEMDGGMKMPETMAIARFLARENKFYPTSSIDIMKSDYISDCFYEILHDYMRYFHWKNGRFRFGTNGEEMSSTTSSTSGNTMDSNCDNYMQWRFMNTFNRVMPFMERTLTMRDDGGKFFLGDQLMWCDMMMYCTMENVSMENQSMLNEYPKLMALYQRISSHPKISQYLKSRPKTNW